MNSPKLGGLKGLWRFRFVIIIIG